MFLDERFRKIEIFLFSADSTGSSVSDLDFLILIEPVRMAMNARVPSGSLTLALGCATFDWLEQVKYRYLLLRKNIEQGKTNGKTRTRVGDHKETFPGTNLQLAALLFELSPSDRMIMHYFEISHRFVVLKKLQSGQEPRFDTVPARRLLQSPMAQQLILHLGESEMNDRQPVRRAHSEKSSSTF